MSIFLTIKKIFVLLSNKQKKALIFLFFLMFVSMILEIFSIGLILPALSLIDNPDIITKYSFFRELYIYYNEPSYNTLIIFVIITLCLFYLLKTICITFVTWKQLQLSFGIQVELSHQLYKNYLNNDYSFHFSRNSSTLIRNVTIEIDQFGGAITASLNLIAEILIVIGLGLLLLIYQPISTLILGLALGISSLLFFKIIRNSVYIWGKARQFHQGQRIQYIQQGLGAIKQIKILNKEDNFIKNYNVHNKENGRVNMLEHLMTRIPRFFLELIAVFCFAGLIAILLIEGSNQIIPTVGLFAGAAFRLLPSVSRIVGSAQGLRYSLPSVDVLFEEFDNKYQTQKEESIKNISFTRSLEIKNVSFQYDESISKNLHDINFKVNFGDSIGFIGESGSGKSTLMDIIIGLIDPQEGEILVDNISIEKGLNSWQSQIGYVPQDIYMIDDSLTKNIALGLDNDEIDIQKVRNAIQLSQLEDFVNTLPQGLETEMGERGIRLSGGQLQRVGIARALYNNPKILIFDEASSALDAATEEKIIKEIDQLKRDKTILIISHRLSTLQHCDFVYEIKDGKISLT